ncbi:hypothetical protein AC1031_012120 [Aphanomyces cochlioides]|nr:hypothetical protein AC1031_012120 [Aphanomyces cochlioides]
MVGRGSGFTKSEVESLLELLETYLPLCTTEWEAVLKKHEQRYPAQNRTVDSIRRKFANLYRAAIPTGDPLIPHEVRRAKTIRSKMNERAAMGDGSEIDDYEIDHHEDMQEEVESEQLIDKPPNNSFLADDQDAPAAATSTSSVASSFSGPRPLVRKRFKQENEDASTMLELMKMQMLLEEKRLQIERERREDERQRREEERRERIEEWRQRELERQRRHDEFDQERRQRQEEMRERFQCI